jgi:hypothetical protein
MRGFLVSLYVLLPKKFLALLPNSVLKLLSQIIPHWCPDWVLRGCEGGYPPRRLVLKPAREPPQKQKPANGTRAGRQAMYARAHWLALASPVEWVLGIPLGFLNGVKQAPGDP